MNSLPPYLEQALLSQYGPYVDQISVGYSARRPTTLRVNTLKASMEGVTEALRAQGIAYQPVGWYADAMVLPTMSESEVLSLSICTQGEVYLQGLTAMLPPLGMSFPRGCSVLDMCAAPGGKTAQIAALTQSTVSITACEKDRFRCERLRHNLKQQGVHNVTVLQTDSRHLDPAFRFDRILLDAPCSGSGTLCLQDAPRRMEQQWVQKLKSTQIHLLEKGLSLLSSGGELVYSTCSILREENEEVLQMVLPRFHAETVPLPDELTAAMPKLPVVVPNTLCVCPTPLYEGFFVAKIVKA